MLNSVCEEQKMSEQFHFKYSVAKFTYDKSIFVLHERRFSQRIYTFVSKQEHEQNFSLTVNMLLNNLSLNDQKTYLKDNLYSFVVACKNYLKIIL